MATQAIDFSGFAVEDPITTTLTTLIGDGVRTRTPDSTTVCSPTRSGVGHASHYNVSMDRHQGVEMVIHHAGTNGLWTNNNEMGAIAYAATNNFYSAYVADIGITSSDNRLRKFVAGTGSNVTGGSFSALTFADNDVLFIEVDDDGAGDTDITVYYNPTGYDGNGFPTGASTTIGPLTDATSPHTSGTCGIQGNGGNVDNAFISDLNIAGIAAASGTYRSIDAMRRGRIIHVR